MCTQSDDEINVELYQRLLNQHGDSYKSLHWGSVESQTLRFQIITEIGMKTGDSVLDVGCGLGDYYVWLNENKIKLNYCGLDVTPEMILKAQSKYPDIPFICGTLFDRESKISDTYDYTVASGLFTHRRNNPEKYMRQTINELFSIARIGCAFNSLSSRHTQQEEGEFYADPIKTMQYCRSLTPLVELRDEYHRGDFTIYMLKEFANRDQVNK